MKRSRFLVATGYWLALLLLVLPLLQPVVTLLPPRPDDVRWRLQAFGAFSLSLLFPVLGAVVAIATAVLLGHRRAVQALSASVLLGAVLLAALATLFALDLVQYQGAVEAELQRYYRVAGAVYLLALSLGTLFLFWLAAVSWRAAARSRRVPRQTSEGLSADLEAGGDLPVLTDPAPRHQRHGTH